MSTEFLTIEELGKAYPGAPEPVFEGVNFGIQRGEFVCIIGHSGCGKTTILNTLAGLEHSSEGHVFMDGREVTAPGLERGVVFQGHALMPWLTVRQNIAFAVRSKWPEKGKAEVRSHVEKYVQMVGLSPAIDKLPSQLSGGMKQRVGIARAFAIEPKMLLLDEPFGALDALTRTRLQNELQRIWQKERITMLLVTHDVEEAVFLGDRVVVMQPSPGRIRRTVAVDLPHPRNRSDPAFIRLRDDVLSDFVDAGREEHAALPYGESLAAGAIPQLQLAW